MIFKRKKKPLKIIATHHKTGTVLVRNIFRDISKPINLKFHYGKQKDLSSRTDIWLQDHSYINFDSLKCDYKGIHIVRNPISIVKSGYNYHKICKEKWCLIPLKKFLKKNPWFPKNLEDIDYDKSYQECINLLPEKEGMLLEMQTVARKTIYDMYEWNYTNTNFLEIHLEDIFENFDAVFNKIFHFLNFQNSEIEPLLKIASGHDLNRQTLSQIKSNSHVTNKSLNKNHYIDQWSSEYHETFTSIFPKDVFSKLGYPSPKF